MLQLPEHSIFVVFHAILSVWNEQAMWAAQWSKKETVHFKINSEGGAVNKRKFNLMFFWPCIMNWLYINYQLDAPTIIYS